MQQLRKVTPGGPESKTPTPPQELSPIVKHTLDAFSRITDPKEDASVAKIEVHDTVSNVAWAYEKLRNVIDYQDEHLLRKNAIERILKRRVVSGISASQVAEPLILELIRSRYLPNNALPSTMIGAAGDVINRYIQMWSQVPNVGGEEQTKLMEFWLGMLSVQLNELLSPTEREEALARLMFETTHRDISFADGEIDEAEKNTQIYIAIHRALLKSDANIIRYHLFLRLVPDWKQPSPELIAKVGASLPAIRQRIERQVTHSVGDLLHRIMKKYVIIFWTFDDLAKNYGAEATEKFKQPDSVVDDVKAAYAKRRKDVQSKIARSTLRSIIYVFITKMLLALVIELPVDRWLAGGKKFDYTPLFINALFHPFVLLLIGVTNQVPGDKNMKALTEKMQALVYRGHERNALVRPRKPIHRNTLFTYLYRFVYGLTFIVVFGAMIWVLSVLGFTPFSSFIFLLFLTIVSFFGIRVRLLAKELLVVDQRENVFTVLFDFFTVPILQVGRWIAMRAPKVNVLIFFLDVIIEAPFKAFLEAAEGFFGFLREKREEIY